MTCSALGPGRSRSGHGFAELMLMGLLIGAISCNPPPPPPPPASRIPAASPSQPRPRDSKSTAEVIRTDTVVLPLDTGARIFSVSVDMGRIELTTDPAATEIRCAATLRLRAPSQQLAEDYAKEVRFAGNSDGETLTFTTHIPQQWRQANFANRPGGMEVDLVITGPPGINWQLSVGTGPLRVRGTLGEARLETRNGPLDAGDGIDGVCSLEARNGNLTAVIRHAPRVSAVATNGNLKVDFIGTKPFGGFYTATASNGNAEIVLPPIGTNATVSLHSGNGNLAVRMPRQSTTSISADSTNGQVEIIGAVDRIGAQTANSFRGLLGNPLSEVTLNAVNGNVRLELLEEDAE